MLYRFPLRKRSKWGETWRKIITQKALIVTCPKAMKLWKLSKNWRLFSAYFIVGIRTTRNQNSTETLKEDAIKKNFVFVSSQFKEKTNSNFQVKSIQQKVVNEVKRSEGNKVSASLSSQVLRIVFVVDSSVDNINNSDTDIHLDNI